MKNTILLFLLMAGITSSATEGLAENWNWTPSNQKTLDHYVNQTRSRVKKGSNPSVSVFDWDNTVIKNDIGDATLFHLLKNDLILMPSSWKNTSDLLHDSAIRSLESSCKLAKGRALRTSDHPHCIDAILSIYLDGVTLSDKGDVLSAWKTDFNVETMEPAYAWASQLLSGYTPEEVRNIARQVIQEAIQSPIGSKQKLGKRSVPNYVRVYTPIHQLIRSLQDSGSDVWISSASNQYLVEEFATRVGIPSNRVIGLRPLLDGNGRILPKFERCGGLSSGIINYRLGKRCWINQIIFKRKDKDALNSSSPIDFAAGDADTDYYFLKDARLLRVVINRNKRQVMCAAISNQDRKWLIQPMWIEPLPRKAEPYDCTPFGLEPQSDPPL